MADESARSTRAKSVGPTPEGWSEGDLALSSLVRSLPVLAFIAAVAIAPTSSAQYDGSGGGERRPDAVVHVGGDLGLGSLETAGYYLANITTMVRVGPVRADLWVPLRFATRDFTFRDADYDAPRDFARIGRCIRLDLGSFTPPEDRYDPACEAFGWDEHGLHGRVYSSTRLLPFQNFTLGHGSIVYAYRSSLDFNRPQLGAVSDFIYGDAAEAHVMVDDIVRPGLIAGHAFVRPQQLLFGQNWDETPDDGVIGVTWASDIHAPLTLQTALGRPLVDTNGDLLFTRDSVNIIGLNAHYMYLWGLGGRGPRAGMFFFADYNNFVGVGDADALHTGARFVVKDESSGWEMRLGAEYRYLGNRYIPEYFDTDYTTRSQRFAVDDAMANSLGIAPQTTKLEFLRGRAGGYVHGFQAYFQLIVPIPQNGGHHRPLPIAVFFEEATGRANATFSAMVGPLQIDQLVVAAQFLRRSFDGFEDFASLNGAIFRLIGRFYVGGFDREENWLDNVTIDFRYDRRFFLDQQATFRQTDDVAVTVGFQGGT